LTAVDLAARASLVREAPELFSAEQGLAKRLIDLARVMLDWEKMLLAIDFEITQQLEFVRGWTEKVQRKGGVGGGAHSDVQVRGHRWSVAEAEARTGINKQQVSRWRSLLAPDQIEEYRQRQRDRAYEEAGIIERTPHRIRGTGATEWFTPPPFIAAARSVLGEIDLDPATHPKAQKRVKATRFYTKAEDGLRQEWRGRVWLNPPYGRVDVALFVEKLLDHYQRQEVTAAILLTHNYTDTKWFHAAVAVSAAVCFTRGRIYFEDNNGDTCKPTQGQAFFYFGGEANTFAERFRDIGFLMRPVND